MKKILVLFAAITLIAACAKDNGAENKTVNLSPEGKQWFVELDLSPDNGTYIVDFSVGGGNVVFMSFPAQYIKIFSDFYFYSDSSFGKYTCTKSEDGNSYELDLGTLFPYPITFTPYSKDIGIVSWILSDEYSRLCQTSEKLAGRAINPVAWSSYSKVDLKIGTNSHQEVVTNKDGATNFNKLVNTYECVKLNGGGSAADYEGKDVKGKVVFVSDDESVSMSKKREIATEKEAAALIVYRKGNADYERVMPYKKTIDAIPSGEGLPVGVLYSTEVAIDNSIKNSTTVSFPKG